MAKELGFVIELSENESGTDAEWLAVTKQLEKRSVFPVGLRVQVFSRELERMVRVGLVKLTSAGNTRSKYPPAVTKSLRVMEKV